VSVTTSIEPATTSTDPVSLLPVTQCIDPPTSESATEVNSSFHTSRAVNKMAEDMIDSLATVISKSETSLE